LCSPGILGQPELFVFPEGFFFIPFKMDIRQVQKLLFKKGKCYNLSGILKMKIREIRVIRGLKRRHYE
jgi:hypothetical protein